MVAGEEAGGDSVNYRIVFLSGAEREFLRLSKGVRLRLSRHIEALAADPRPAGCVKLTGSQNIWRIRVGDYRVLYTIDDAGRTVTVTRVAHRRESYR